jgi:signal transduction histidine kinase
VIVNLLDNAVHAVGDSGEVRIRGGRDGERLSLTIEDNGPGIEPSIVARLFEPLITTKTKGIGLGLALVRRIVESHGGTVSSEPPSGRGARFVVRLPVSTPDA